MTTGQALVTFSSSGNITLINNGDIDIPTFFFDVNLSWDGDIRNWRNKIELPGGVVQKEYEFNRTYCRPFYVEAGNNYTIVMQLLVPSGVNVTINPGRSFDHYASMSVILPN
jgi:hypothetical protein